jgi:hypothetical protein
MAQMRGNGRSKTAANHTTPAGKRTQVVESKSVEVTSQQIAEAAYFLWRQRGGNETVNWLEAERMLKSQATGGGLRAGR